MTMPTHPIKTIDAQHEFACLLLVNITETIAGCEAGAIPRSGAEAGLLRILDAVIEGFDAGMDHVHIAFVHGAGQLDEFLAANDLIGGRAAAMLKNELGVMLVKSGIPSRRFRFVDDGAPIAAADAIADVREASSGKAVAVIVPHEMRRVETACLRDLIDAYNRCGDPATLVAAYIAMDSLPKIEWLARRGSDKVVWRIEEAESISPDLAELRMIGRCILAPDAASPEEPEGRRSGVTLIEILNSALTAGRRVIAREYARATPEFQPDCPISLFPLAEQHDALCA